MTCSSSAVGSDEYIYPFIGICQTSFHKQKLEDHITSIWKDDYPQGHPTVITTDDFIINHPVWKTPLDEPSFDLNNFYSKLHTETMGQTLLYSHQLTSTQTILKDNFRDFQSGLVCVADKQTAGKGRSKNKWDSPYGCLMFSFKTYITQQRDLPLLQYLVTLIMVSSLNSVYESKNLGVCIKWPNDIYFNRDKKLGGIICQSSFNGRAFDVTVGIGINISNNKPTTCMDAIASDYFGKHVNPGRSSVLASFCNQFSEAIKSFRSYGFEPFMKDYMKIWMHTNEVITVVNDEDESITQEAKIRGINSLTGMLEAEDKNGHLIELFPDTHSLNLMDKLIYKKK